MTDHELRQRAEEHLRSTHTDGEPGERGTKSTEEVLHDLRVHQIELEMQNEELRRAQELVAASSHAHAALFQQSPVGMMVIDGSGRIVRCNRVFREILPEGREPIGRFWPDFLTPVSANHWRSRYRSLATRPEEKRIELEIDLGVDRRRVVRLSFRSAPELFAHAAQTQEPDAMLLVAVMDVTDEVLAQERSSALLAEKDLLLRELRHRTQNHLQTILSMLSVHASFAQDQQVVDALTSAGERVRSMLLVNDLLSSAKAATGAATIGLDQYVGDLVERIRSSRLAPVELVYTNATQGRNDGRTPAGTSQLPGDAQVSRDARASHNAGIEVESSDAFALGLVLNELITNAYKYAFPEGHPGRVEISIENDETATRVIVADNGIGMPKGNESSGPPAPNTPAPSGGRQDSGGFGLQLVEGLVAQIGGEISHSPASDTGGTRFVIHLPWRPI